MIPTNITIQDQWCSIVVYSENSQTFMMEPFPKIVKCFQPLIMFVKSSILYVWLGSECASSWEIKETMPRCWYFVGCFLSLRKLMLPHVKSIWQIILNISRKSSFNNNWRYDDHINKLYFVIRNGKKYFTFFLSRNVLGNRKFYYEIDKL